MIVIGLYCPHLATYTYLIGFVRVSDDFGRVTDKEHNDDATKKSGHSFVPPVPGGECVVDLTVPVFIF